MMDNVNELILLRASAVAIQERVNRDLSALVAKIDALLPEEPARRQIPAGHEARKKYYKKALQKTKAR